jgi:hypothetical protein
MDYSSHFVCLTYEGVSKIFRTESGNEINNNNNNNNNDNKHSLRSNTKVYGDKTH